jgi:membrane-bound inhibitor of C-type lysozyme
MHSLLKYLLPALLLFGCATCEAPELVRVEYLSETGERLAVTYDNVNQQVTLSTEAGPVTLPRAVSASGARFTADEGEVFWNKGSRAMYWKSGELLFEGIEESNKNGAGSGARPL